MQVLKEDNAVPVKMWTDHVPIEEEAKQQLKNLAKLPFIHRHVAAMPDVHWGMGATIGSVIATKGAVIPAAVGVDIGCGMMVVPANLSREDLPEDLSELRADIEKAVPHGRTNNGGKGDRGAWHDTPEGVMRVWDGQFKNTYEELIAKHPKMKAFNTYNHLGTLGTGNHFIELCLDTEDKVWIMFHSGSRGMGNKIGTYFINAAKELMKSYFIELVDKDLAYLPEGTELFDDYMKAVQLAQDFALSNRAIMLAAVYKVLKKHVPDFKIAGAPIDCHHNYVDRENHFGENILITRKGAVRARKGDYGIIPGSMGAKSFIVRGLGNAESFCSCSHGAGRVMSRRRAKEEISIEQHIKDTNGVECRKDLDVVDESPRAYKDIDSVMKSQEDLVEIVTTLKQILCVKG